MCTRHRTAIVLSVALALAVGCTDDPTRPSDPEPLAPPPATLPPTGSSSGDVLADGTVVIDAKTLRLVSSVDEIDRGIYRYQRLSSETPAIKQGNILVGATSGGDLYLRRVLVAERSSEWLTFKTMEAYWPDALEGGRYQYRMAVAGQNDGSNGLRPAFDLSVDGTATLNPDGISVPLVVDWCQALPDVADQMDEPLASLVRSFQLCNRPDPACASLGPRVLTVCGNLSALETRGTALLTGSIGVGFTIDEGSVRVTDPGEAPTFSPCSGDPDHSICFNVSDWAAWVRDVLNSPPLSLGFPTNRPKPSSVCIPGTPYGSLLDPKICKITDWGDAPTIEVTPPSLENVGFNNSLSLTYDLATTIEGDGSVEFELPLPYISIAGGCPGGGCALKIGDFLVLGAEFSETRLTIGQNTSTGYSLDLAWNSTSGWTSAAANAGFSTETDLQFERPGTVVLRAGLRPLFLFELGILPQLGPFAGAIVLESNMTDAVEDTWTQPSDCPATPPASSPAPLCGNWQHDLDYVETTYQEASLTPPASFLWPDVDLSATFDYELLRLDIEDYFGRGDLAAQVTTSGEPILDPYGEQPFNGYTLALDRRAPAGSGAFSPYSFTDPQAIDASGNPVVLTGTISGLDGTHAFSNSEGVNWTREGLFGGPVHCRQKYDFLSGELTEVLDCSLAAGVEQFLTIANVGVNCAVQNAAGIDDGSGGPATYWRSLRLTAGETREEPLSVQCQPPVGTIQVTANSAGIDIDPDGYDVILDGESAAAIVPPAVLTELTDIHVGDHTVGIAGVAFNCQVGAFDPGIRVPYAQTVGKTIPIQCASVLATLAGKVEAFLANGAIDNTGVGGSLLRKLAAATDARTRGEIASVIEILESFIGELEDQAGQHIEAAAAAELVANASFVLSSGILGS
jgi:hypothetical protein